MEPQDTAVNQDSQLTCTLLVECSTILNNMGDLTEGKESLVPSDGIIYGPATVVFYEGESVYDVLLREMQNNRIHMEAEFTPMYNSAYVEGINNFYEFDCGRWSGWMYCVNGWYPNYGASRYQVRQGDVIEWHYTCDLGRDLGRDTSGWQNRRAASDLVSGSEAMPERGEKRVDTFAEYHPLINFIYFVMVIGIAMFYMHPVLLGCPWQGRWPILSI